jgi:hypothetical protein
VKGKGRKERRRADGKRLTAAVKGNAGRQKKMRRNKLNQPNKPNQLNEPNKLNKPNELNKPIKPKAEGKRHTANGIRERLTADGARPKAEGERV